MKETIEKKYKQILDKPIASFLNYLMKRDIAGNEPYLKANEIISDWIWRMNVGMGDILEYDAELMWRLIPNTKSNESYIDADSMFDGPYSKNENSNSNIKRVMFLGTSILVTGEQSLVKRIREYCKDDMPDVEIINAAVPGYSVVQHRKWFEKIISIYKPTHILALSIWNEIWPRNLMCDDEMLLAIALSRDKPENFITAVAKKCLYYRWRLTTDEPRVPVSTYQNEWLKIIKVCKDFNTKPGFFFIPVKFDSEPMKRFLRLHSKEWLPLRYEKYRKVFFKIARKYPFCDLTRAAENEAERLYDSSGQHLSERGIDVCARELKRFLCSWLSEKK